jgi:hypothetical protein
VTVNDTVPTGRTPTAAELADPYIPAGPLQRSPGGFYKDATRREALDHVLRGVELGEHDERIVDWILQWDDSTIRTIASLIERARNAACEQCICLDPAQLDTVLDGLDEAADGRQVSAARVCSDCEAHPAELCGDHADDLDRAGRYSATARQLRQEAGR